MPLDKADVKHVQRLQNRCLRLIYGIKHNKTFKRIERWLNMCNRWRLRMACSYHKLFKTGVAPSSFGVDYI